MDYGRQGNQAGVLVDYDDYGYEMEGPTPGGPYVGNRPISPVGGPVYQDSRANGIPNKNSRSYKYYNRKRDKQKGYSPSKHGGTRGGNNGRRHNPRRKYSSEDERIYDYDG